MYSYYAEIFKLVLVVITIIAIWKIGQLSAESFYDWLRGKIWPKGKWLMIDDAEMIKTLKEGDKIKYTLNFDRYPYKKGIIKDIEIEHLRNCSDVIHRIYIKTLLGSDILMLNCMTGFDIPYLGRGSILYLYRWQTEDVKIEDPIILVDPASKDGDCSVELTAKRKGDGSVEVLDVKYGTEK